MHETVRLMVVCEETGAKNLLAERLAHEVAHTIRVDSLADALTHMKRHSFDAVVLSADMQDQHTVASTSKMFRELGSVREIFLVSEQAGTTPDVMGLMDIALTEQQILKRLAALENERGATEQPVRQVVEESSLFDNAPTGLYRIEPDGRFVETNRTFAAMLKAPDDKAMRSDTYFQLFRDREDANTWRDLIAREKTIRNLVFELRRYDGQSIWVRDTVRSVTGPDGQVRFHDGSIEDITVQKRLEDKLSFLATQDILTGLPNRNFFHDQAKLTISQARYSDDCVAFLVIDIDDFSSVNEEHGIKVGDRVLQLAAMRIKGQLRKTDLVARLGSDKFIILLSGIRTRKDAFTVAKKIGVAFSDPFEVQDGHLHVSASLGIALYPEHGEEVNTLIKRAEIATFAAKDQDRGRAMMYSGLLTGTGEEPQG